MTNVHDGASRFGPSGWFTSGTSEWRENLQLITGPLKPDDERMTRAKADHETCSYCGSITPQYFVELCARPEVVMEVADWKYGWPHKVYIDIPQGGHFKFYTIHIADLEDLEKHSALILSRTNVHFFKNEEGKIMWKAKPRGRYDGA